jgi:hypothetical protein
MCEHLKESGGKCCGECDKPKICDCGAILPKGEKIIRCTSCLDIICSQCGHKDWNETGLPACILDDCKNEVTEKYIQNLIIKLDAAAYALSVIETRTSEQIVMYSHEIKPIHTIAQKAYRAAK